MLHVILNAFRAVLYLSSGGQIVLLQHLVSPLSVNGHSVCRLGVDFICSQPACCMAVYREWRYQML